MTMVSLEVVRFSAIECSLQMSGEISVANMVEGFIYAQNHRDQLPTVTDVLELGKIIEPVKNAQGFRRCGVQIGWDVKRDWELIPSQMVSLSEALRDGRVTAEEYFKLYEESHPYIDGNGRTGVLLYLWISGKLDDPDWPPDYWNDPRRYSGHGAPRVQVDDS